MKRMTLFFAAACLLILSTLPAHAQDRGLGLGVAIGQPNGIVGKVWLNDVNAVDFGLGMAIGPTTVNASGDKENVGSRIHLHGDFLYHMPDKIQSTEKFPLYIGAGAYVESGGLGDDAFGIRGVGGLAYWVQQAPLDLFLEVAPTLQLTPSAGFGFQTSIGVRYYFGE